MPVHAAMWGAEKARAAEALVFELQLLLRQSRELEHLGTDLDQEIGRRDSGVDQSLRTIPGVGATTASAIDAAIGGTAGQAKMCKRGSPSLRRAVWQAALTACRLAPLFQTIDDCQRQQGKHHLVALSHVANKPTRVIDAVLRGQRPYHSHAH